MTFDVRPNSDVLEQMEHRGMIYLSSSWKLLKEDELESEGKG